MAKLLVNIRLDPELKEAAAKAADAESRSLTGFVEALLVERCKQLGTLPKDWLPTGRKVK